MIKYKLELINEYIFARDIIDEDEFKRFFLELFSERSERYYDYCLQNMYRRNVLYKYGLKKLKPCKYRKKFNFRLNIDDKLKYRMEQISPSIIVSIWDTAAFSHLTSLQMLNDIIIVETYSYTKEFVLKFLLEEGKFAIYEEDYLVMSKYSNKTKLYIIRTLNEECPIVRRTLSIAGRTDNMPSFVTVPKIEKILVDFIVDEIYRLLFSAEINRIYYQVLRYYQINMSTVLRYAKKRHSYQKVLNYLEYINFDVESGEFR